MARIVVEAGHKASKPDAEVQIMKIMYSETEPPKDYIWGKPDGTFYEWKCGNWQLYTMPDIPKGKPCCDCCCDKGYVTRKELDEAIALLKRDLLNAIIRVAKPCCSDSSVEEYIQEELIPRLEALEAIDHSKFVVADNV